jgi:small-conductance mechanosensitive channel/CRP-like cAMP-binding protein
MPRFADPVINELMTYGGAGMLVTILLLLLGRLLLPKEERRELRLPLILLLLHIGVMAGHHLLFGRSAPSGLWAAAALCLLLAALARVAFLLVVDWFIEHRLKRHVPRIFRDILQVFVFVVAALVVFRSVGVDLGSLLTTSAIITAVIGLSLQETLGNLFAGLAVQAERPFTVGDWVEIGEKLVGRVTEINWRATKIQTADRFEIVVPNSLIARSALINCSRPLPIGRRLVVFQGPYDVPPNQIRRLVLDALRDCPMLLDDPPPTLWTSNYLDSGIEYTIAYFLERFEKRRDIESDIRDRIWYALRRANIGMPFPVRDVRVQNVPAAPGARGMDVQSREAVLRSVSELEPLPLEVRLRVAERADELLFSAGEPVIVEGDVANALFVVAKGGVTVVGTTAEGRPFDLAKLGPSQLFGEMSLSTGVRGATVRADVDSVVLRITRADFKAAIDQVPGLGQAMVARIAARQRASEARETAESSGKTDEGNQDFFQRLRRLFGVG